MDLLRTPDERFFGLPEFPFQPHYLELPSGQGGSLRLHYLDEGPRAAPPVLMLHGEPSWGFLYRKLLPILTGAGLRAIVPDLVGFGRSDKPSATTDYTYQRHVDWMAAFIAAIDLQGATLLCQDWGGLIGLRLVAEQGARFARVVAANTFLPTGDSEPSAAFLAWRKLSQTLAEFPAGRIVQGGCMRKLSPEVMAAYDAPFPDESYKAGARQFPVLVPATPDDPASAANRAAWEQLRLWRKPFLTAFGDSDPITRGADRVFQEQVPGAQGLAHVTFRHAGHFLQEDVGEELARVLIAFVSRG